MLRDAPLRTWCWIVGVAALVVRIPLSITSHEAVPGGDSAQYLAIADRLVDEGVLTTDGYRTGGYPLFIALFDVLPGRREDTVVVAQHLIGAALAVAILVFAWRFFGRGPAIAAAALAAVVPVMPALENMLLADFLLGVFAFAGAAVLALAVADRVSWRLLLLCGLLFGVAANVKPSGQFLIAAVPIALLVTTRSLRRSAGWSLVAIAAFAVAVLPWMLHNRAEHGNLSLSVQGGRTLFNRVFEVDRLPIPTDTPDGRFVKRVDAEIAGDPDLRLNNVVLDRWMARGIPRDGAIERQGRLARQAIREHPFEYAAGTAERLPRFATDVNKFSYDDLHKPEVGDVLERLNVSGPGEAAIRVWFYSVKALSVAWLVLSLAGLAGALTLVSPDRRVRAAGAALIGTWLAFALGTALGHGGLWRYSASMAPLIWVFGAAGAALLLQRVSSRVRSLPLESEDVRCARS